MQQLLKYTSEDHVDYAQLRDAYDKMYSLAEYINEKKREVWTPSLAILPLTC